MDRYLVALKTTAELTIPETYGIIREMLLRKGLSKHDTNADVL